MVGLGRKAISEYLCIYASMHLCIYVSMHLCIYVCVCASMCVCMYMHVYPGEAPGQQLESQLFGIGLKFVSKNDEVKVLSVTSGGPADAAGSRRS